MHLKICELLSNIFWYLFLTKSHRYKRTESVWFQYFWSMQCLHLVLCPWICFSVFWFMVYGNLNRIYILLLCENCVNLNYAELVCSAFQVYYASTLMLIHFINFWSFILKLQLKILIFLFKNYNIYSETICNFVLYFLSFL